MVTALRRCVLLALLAADGVQAQNADLDALQLADQTPTVEAAASDWRIFIEGAAGQSQRRSDGKTVDTRRLSLDVQLDHGLSLDWRVFVADRLDTVSPVQAVDQRADPRAEQHTVNTLKEAYLSGRLAENTLVDVGRVNPRNGVAMGYNPTDFFRNGALRSVVSINPASLKENRQGSTLVRGQRLWEGGSLTALYSPRLTNQANPDGLSLDTGATNHQDRWLLSLSQRMGDGLTPQFLLYGEAGASVQGGFNLTGLINDRTVAYLEWSGGRSPTQLNQALPPPFRCTCADWHNRVSTGLTYTTANKLSLTAEYQYNGAALDEAGWQSLRQGPASLYGLYRNWVQIAQEMPTREALFFLAQWQDAMIHGLDLSAMVQRDQVDASHRLWWEARYHQDRMEYALQWQRTAGAGLSNYGVAPERLGWQLSMRYYF